MGFGELLEVGNRDSKRARPDQKDMVNTALSVPGPGQAVIRIEIICKDCVSNGRAGNVLPLVAGT